MPPPRAPSRSGIVKAAKTSEEARAGALGVGAVLGGAGAAKLGPLGVMGELDKIIMAKAAKGNRMRNRIMGCEI